MPKVVNYPRLRTLVRRGASGQRWVYYYYDMRHLGVPDISLGKDHAAALVRWHELHHDQPKVVGRVQEAINQWRQHVLIGTKDSPSRYTNPDTRRDYTRHLARIEAWCGQMAWHEITLPLLRQYLERRKGKTQANRELSVFQIVWNYARVQGLTELHWPAAGMEKSKWKNEEQPRSVEISDEMFAAVHACGDQILKDAMDIASATSMRVKDVLTVVLPRGDILHLKASKTGKKADFDISLSKVLPELVKRRRANKRAMHLKLLTSSTGREVTYRMLYDRFVEARDAAVLKAQKEKKADLAIALRTMILRDCRRYAADQVETAAEAQLLLQHGDLATTVRHYRTRGDKVRPAR